MPGDVANGDETAGGSGVEVRRSTLRRGGPAMDPGGRFSGQIGLQGPFWVRQKAGKNRNKPGTSARLPMKIRTLIGSTTFPRFRAGVRVSSHGEPLLPVGTQRTGRLSQTDAMRASRGLESLRPPAQAIPARLDASDLPRQLTSCALKPAEEARSRRRAGTHLRTRRTRRVFPLPWERDAPVASHGSTRRGRSVPGTVEAASIGEPGSEGCLTLPRQRHRGASD